MDTNVVTVLTDRFDAVYNRIMEYRHDKCECIMFVRESDIDNIEEKFVYCSYRCAAIIYELMNIICTNKVMFMELGVLLPFTGMLTDIENICKEDYPENESELFFYDLEKIHEMYHLTD